jgi:non-specific serine/threonine protein kinase
LVRGARLVTVTGVGGAGKTRLSLQVAAGFGEEHRDGVWFVELATVTDPDMVPAQAAEALGVQENPGEPILERLMSHLGHKSVLLVLDNCEHVINAAADLVEAILRGSPDSSILATSRELLGVGGEVAYGMRSMAMPRDLSGIGPTELARYDAVQLFLERAASAKPDFSITADNAPSVAEICQRLDGMPLGIELAAARLRSFTPQQIADHLDQRFRILTGGARTALPRQQTLAAAIDWSYRLLDERERLLFERLAVFQGGFDLEAAQQVCASEELDEFDIFELVPVLVDKSLVNADVGGDAARYRLLETIRQFARERLDDDGATDIVRRRHAEYFMGLAEKAEPNVRGEQERAWWDRLDRELDNLRLALEWSLEAGEPELGMRLAGAFWRFWWFTYRFSEGVQWLRRMHAAGGAVPQDVYAKLLVGLGTLSGFTNDQATAEAVLSEAVDIYRELYRQGVDPALLKYSASAALINYSATYAEPNQYFELSEELNTEALELSRAIGDDIGVAVALGNLAESASRRGDIEAARRGYAESIAASRALYSAHRIVESIIQYAVFEASVDEHERASEVLEEAMEASASGSIPLYVAMTGALRAEAGQHLGEPDARDRFIAHASVLYADPEFASTYWPQLAVALGRADIECQLGNLERAATLLGVVERLEDESAQLDVVFEPRRVQVRDAVIAALGEEQWETARDHGKGLSFAEAARLVAGE